MSSGFSSNSSILSSFTEAIIVLPYAEYASDTPIGAHSGNTHYTSRTSSRPLVVSLEALRYCKCGASKCEQYFECLLFRFKCPFRVILIPRTQIIAPPIIPNHDRNIMLLCDTHFNTCPTRKASSSHRTSSPSASTS